MKKLKTITLGTGDNPAVALCPGHVGSRAFNAASAHEWEGGLGVARADLVHEWRRVSPKGQRYSKVGKDAKGAKPFTAVYL